MEQRYYVYILRSVKDSAKTYVGFTTRLEDRLQEHNEGSQVYSSRYAPWERIAYIAFSGRESALAFEKYLKSPSGKAFLAKHFLRTS